MENKKELRKRILNIRSSMSLEDAEKNSNIILDKIINMNIYKQSKLVFVYMDFNKEVMTSKLMEHMLCDKKRLVIPYTNTKNIALIPSEITKQTDLKLNSFGYYEPVTIRPIDPKEIDLVIVPGLVFDKQLNRIGFGKGYYDRILVKLKPSAFKMALAHEFQVLESIPAEEHDIKMDMIVTEKSEWKGDTPLIYGDSLRDRY